MSSMRLIMLFIDFYISSTESFSSESSLESNYFSLAWSFARTY